MMTLIERQKLFARLVATLIVYINSKSYTVTFGEAFRTKEQAEIYFKKGMGIKNSLHCKRLAIDLNIFNPDGDLLSSKDELQLFGNFWEKLNPECRWGGNFKERVDADHFELKDSSV